jgi:signal transduction histidine kinase
MLIGSLAGSDVVAMWPFSSTRESSPILDASLENKRQRLLEEHQRLANAQASLLSVASRELRDPLIRLQGYTTILSEMAQVGQMEPQQADQIVGGIVQNAQALREAVENALDTVSIEANALELACEPLAPSKLVWETLATHRDAILNQGLQVKTHGLDTLPHVYADRQRVTQALEYILENCITQAKTGGVIQINGQVICPAKGDAEEKHVELGIRGKSRQKEFEERDTLFRPDETNSAPQRVRARDRQATLELIMAQGIIEAHGGHFWTDADPADLEPKRGLGFRIWLPTA